MTQSITITTPAPASAAFNSQFTVSATASSGLPVIYSSGNTDVCINDGAIFTLVAPTGSCIVQYDQPGASGISAAPQLTSDTIALKADQTIGVISLNPATLAVGGTATVSATGGLSGNAVTFSSTTTNVCTVSGSLVTGVAAGQCTIAANQAGDSNYLAAQMTQSFTVTLALSVSSQNVSANLATLVMQSSGSGTGYFTLLNGTSPNTVCGSSAQTAGGLDARGNPAPYYGTLLLTANTNADYTVRNLTHSTAYTACFIADSPNGQNLQPTPVSANLTTAAQASTAGDDWRAVGTAGFSAYTA